MGKVKVEIESIKLAYESGYKAALGGVKISENHYPKGSIAEYTAWAGGWNDYSLGFGLDLSVFD